MNLNEIANEFPDSNKVQLVQTSSNILNLRF